MGESVLPRLTANAARMEQLVGGRSVHSIDQCDFPLVQGLMQQKLRLLQHEAEAAAWSLAVLTHAQHQQRKRRLQGEQRASGEVMQPKLDDVLKEEADDDYVCAA